MSTSKRPNPFRRDYLINVRYGSTIAQYFIQSVTKAEILQLLLDAKLLGEAAEGIDFVEVAPGKSKAIFLGALKDQDI